MNKESKEVDFTEALEQSKYIRGLYNQLEQLSLGRKWTLQEDMLGFSTDVGVLGRLVMASSGTWGYPGDEKEELKHKLSECLWWLMVLSNHLDIDITKEFQAFINKLDTNLTKSIKEAEGRFY
ncbi:hypothetical protein AB3U99_01395 [Niallia sp. JL1B1071]|uniref:hypothetical protein n=1 Tax=Niallia tiangongensis TaxID=3237105 RepID=UPI0037DD493E